MTDAGAAVDVVSIQHRTGKFLHHIVGLIARSPRGTRGHNGPRAVLFFDAFKPVSGIANGLFPGNRGKGLPFAVADHGLRQAGGKQPCIIKKVPAVEPFQAKRALISYAISGFGTDNPVIFNDEVKFAACTAVRADAGGFFHQ